jgi:hypothetical protein
MSNPENFKVQENPQAAQSGAEIASFAGNAFQGNGMNQWREMSATNPSSVQQHYGNLELVGSGRENQVAMADPTLERATESPEKRRPSQSPTNGDNSPNQTPQPRPGDPVQPSGGGRPTTPGQWGPLQQFICSRRPGTPGCESA